VEAQRQIIFIFSWLLMKAIFVTLLFQCMLSIFHAATVGKDAYDTGVTLTQLGRDEEAAEYFWSAILKSNEDPGSYDVRLAVEAFMGTFRRRQMPEQGLLRIARQFKSQGLEKEAMEYLNAVISLNPDIAEAHLLLGGMSSLEPNVRVKYLISALQIDPEGYKVTYLMF
jgi:tetratricopeptide (TPR) repeat protein